MTIWQRVSAVKSAIWILVIIQLAANIGILAALWLTNVQLAHVKTGLADLHDVASTTQESVAAIGDKELKLECSYEPQVFGTIVSNERKLVCTQAK
jgi:hypothetical protein